VAQPICHFKRLYEKVKDGTLIDEEKDLFKPCDINFLNGLFNKSEGDEIRWRYHLYQFSDEEKRELISNDFKKNLNQVSTLSLIEEYFRSVTSNDPLNRVLEMEWNTQLPDQVLAFIDFLSMAHSVEIRSPFLDYRLVEFVATIPGSWKIRNGNVKDILKGTVKSLIPDGITNRPKEGFVLPIFDWMVEKLKDYSVGVLSEKRVRKHNLLNPSKVKDILQNYYSGNRENAGKVWNLMMFQVWWERYFG
jgi:asparagine synthase (glutamine-hydrolysing)